MNLDFRESASSIPNPAFQDVQPLQLIQLPTKSKAIHGDNAEVGVYWRWLRRVCAPSGDRAFYAELPQLFGAEGNLRVAHVWKSRQQPCTES